MRSDNLRASEVDGNYMFWVAYIIRVKRIEFIASVRKVTCVCS